MTKPTLEDLGLDLLHTSTWERLRGLTLPFLTCAGFFGAGSQGYWLAALALAVIQSFFTYASISHDLVHRTLRLPAWLNEALLFSIEALNFRSGHAFRVTHFHHHRAFPGDSDIEGYAAGMALWQALLDGFTAQPRLWLWAFRNSQGTAKQWLVAEAALILLLAVLCLATPVGRAYLVVILAGSWVFPLMTSYLPHDKTGATALQQTRLFRGKVLDLLAFEHLYHLEHHLYPQVPHYRWPDLAKRLDPFFAAQGLQPIILWR